MLDINLTNGKSGARVKLSRKDDHVELAGRTIAEHPAVALLLRLLTDEVSQRAATRRIGFVHPREQAFTSDNTPRNDSDELLELLCRSLVVYVERLHDPTPLPHWGRTIRCPRIERALTLLNDNLAQRWQVQELARAVGLSRAVFARRFLVALGLSPMRYLTQRRMQKAAALLFASDAGLAEIASQVGYDSEFAFSRAFKRHYQVAPSEYRKGVSRATFEPRMAA